uniref:1-(5-phosphoribosyl)-5-[(5-phosphoribosylamino)methylideneamino] imidazole-4-carboxamide isomerase n=1 Tax=Desulfomonile tiedjei TaxID=2358 RepID=A0A7C4EU09_9BACT
MIIIPAIDLKNGKCVRLRQGRFDEVTVFHHDPVAQARSWEDAGAARIHVVDLDGSTAGSPVNRAVIEQIVSSVRVPVQLGGGIRDRAAVDAYLDMGVSIVVLGTTAVKDRALTSELLKVYPGKIALGVDARDGRVAIDGWTKVTEQTAIDLANAYASLGPAYFIYTDIQRDGMMKGPNVRSTREFAMSVSAPVILSGGVSTMTDVEAVLGLDRCGVVGMIIGRALYDGAINLREAIRLAEQRTNAG